VENYTSGKINEKKYQHLVSYLDVFYDNSPSILYSITRKLKRKSRLCMWFWRRLILSYHYDNLATVNVILIRHVNILFLDKNEQLFISLIKTLRKALIWG